jgi:hypothetical protein
MLVYICLLGPSRRQRPPSTLSSAFFGIGLPTPVSLFGRFGRCALSRFGWGNSPPSAEQGNAQRRRDEAAMRWTIGFSRHGY